MPRYWDSSLGIRCMKILLCIKILTSTYPKAWLEARGRAGNYWSLTSKEMDGVCFQRKQVSLTQDYSSEHCCVVWMRQSFDLCVLPLPCCSSVKSGIKIFKFSIAVPVWKGRKSIFRNRSDLNFSVFLSYTWFSANMASISGHFSFEITSLLQWEFHMMIHLPSWDPFLTPLSESCWLVFGY